MMPVDLKTPIPKGTIAVPELASAERFLMQLIARKVALSECIDRLLALPSYQDKIQTLNHQVRTALHVLNNFSHRALLADEVGLGKTIEAGMIIKELLLRKMVKKVLILTPATLKYQWQEEMRSKFSENFEIASEPDVYETNDKVIASIDTAKTPKHAPIVQSIAWDLVVIDEAHKLKNSATHNYKLVKGLEKDRCLMLTATPLQNNIFELWAVVDLLHPGFLETKAKFTENFVLDESGLRIKNKDVLQEKLSKIMVRNLRKETGIKFVDRFVKTHLLDFSKEEMAFYTEAIAFIRKQYEEIRKLEKPKGIDESEEIEEGSLSEEKLADMAKRYRQKGLLTFALIMLTRQITSSIKTGVEALKRYKETLDKETEKRQVEALLQRAKFIDKDQKMDYLFKILQGLKGEKIIIFTTFVHTQKMLEVELLAHGFSSVKFNGMMNPQEKEAAIESFRKEKEVLVCTDAGSEGRNLQFAHIVINYDLPWNPMRIEQRIGRVHRIGQEKDVIIHNIAIKDTIEAYILNRLYEKINLFSVSIGEMDLILSQLKTKQPIEESIFESVLKNDDAFAQDLVKAKESVDEIKKFDEEMFNNGSRAV